MVRVQADLLPLRPAQRSRTVPHGVRDADASEVVQQRGDAEALRARAHRGRGGRPRRRPTPPRRSSARSRYGDFRSGMSANAAATSADSRRRDRQIGRGLRADDGGVGVVHVRLSKDQRRRGEERTGDHGVEQPASAVADDGAGSCRAADPVEQGGRRADLGDPARQGDRVASKAVRARPCRSMPRTPRRGRAGPRLAIPDGGPSPARPRTPTSRTAVRHALPGRAPSARLVPSRGVPVLSSPPAGTSRTRRAGRRCWYARRPRWRRARRRISPLPRGRSRYTRCARAAPCRRPRTPRTRQGAAGGRAPSRRGTIASTAQAAARTRGRRRGTGWRGGRPAEAGRRSCRPPTADPALAIRGRSVRHPCAHCGTRVSTHRTAEEASRCASAWAYRPTVRLMSPRFRITSVTPTATRSIPATTSMARW